MHSIAHGQSWGILDERVTMQMQMEFPVFFISNSRDIKLTISSRFLLYVCFFSLQLDCSCSLTCNLHLFRLRQLCQLFRSMSFRQWSENDHAQTRGINDLKRTGLKNQPSDERVV